MNRTLISILGGLGGMFGWGTSDFFANITSEKIGHEKAFFWSQIAGAFLIVLFMLFLSPSLPSLPLIGLTMLGGVAYALGYLLFLQRIRDWKCLGSFYSSKSRSTLYDIHILLP